MKECKGIGNIPFFYLMYLNLSEIKSYIKAQKALINIVNSK